MPESRHGLWIVAAFPLRIQGRLGPPVSNGAFQQAGKRKF